jgi:HAD superfamily hydrolase (TIGR01509 family)
MKGAILFDVDGTLIDSNELHSSAWQQALRHFGFEIAIGAIREQIGKGGDNLIPALLSEEQVEKHGDAIEDFRSDLFARDYLPRAQPFPGVRALFEKLYGAGIKIVLATSASQEELNFHRSLIGGDDLIHAATSKDDVEHSKPCPDIFQAALAKVSPLGPGEVLVVGDTPWDMKAAAKAGIPAIAVQCGGFPDDSLKAAGALGLYEGPAQLAALFPVWVTA